MTWPSVGKVDSHQWPEAQLRCTLHRRTGDHRERTHDSLACPDRRRTWNRREHSPPRCTARPLSSEREIVPCGHGRLKYSPVGGCAFAAIYLDAPLEVPKLSLGAQHTLRAAGSGDSEAVGSGLLRQHAEHHRWISFAAHPDPRRAYRWSQHSAVDVPAGVFQVLLANLANLDSATVHLSTAGAFLRVHHSRGTLRSGLDQEPSVTPVGEVSPWEK
mmetsp:Transcript_5313/g.15131  ORF Transcript_5313/g.15131 Transcript_5313/m.15131 type:complete len:216 (-) Transcript_5313:792-1439(-)